MKSQDKFRAAFCPPFWNSTRGEHEREGTEHSPSMLGRAAGPPCLRGGLEGSSIDERAPTSGGDLPDDDATYAALGGATTAFAALLLTPAAKCDDRVIVRTKKIEERREEEGRKREEKQNRESR